MAWLAVAVVLLLARNLAHAQGAGLPADYFFNGTVQVYLDPPEAVAAGATWKLSGEATFRASGEKVLHSGLVAIEYRAIDGFTAPPRQTISVSATQHAIVVRARYLKATASPPADLPDLKLSVNGRVNALVAQDDGRVIVAGKFTAVNGVPRQNLARLNPSGTLDPTWSPEVDDEVLALLYAGDRLYVGGRFLRVGDKERAALAVVSTVDAGSLVEGFDAMLGGDSLSIPLVASLVLDAGELYIGGQFASAGKRPRAGLAKLAAATGAVDAAWRENPLFARPRVPIGGLALDGTYLYVQIPDGSLNTGPLRRVIRSGDGAEDPTWQPASVASTQSVLAPSFALLLRGGSLYVGGGFGNGQVAFGLKRVSTDPSATVENFVGVPATVTRFAADAKYLYFGARVDAPALQIAAATGRFIFASDLVDGTWVPSVGEVSTAVGSQADLNAILPSPSSVLLGGSFRTVAGEIAFSLARVDATTAETDFAYFPTIEAPGEARAIVRQDDGKLVIGGSFLLAGGLPRQNLVRLGLDGFIDRTWEPIVNGPVNALAVEGPGLFVGGQFDVVSGRPRVNLARLSTGVTADVDPDWSADCDGPVRAFVLRGGQLFAGGDFQKIGGVDLRGVARLRTTGLAPLDGPWSANIVNGGIATFPVRIGALAATDTHLFFSGEFSSVRGVPRSRLAKVTLAAGALDTAWNPANNVPKETLSGRYNALTVDGSALYVGGDFNSLGGQRRLRLAKLSTSSRGLADARWNPGADAAVSALATDADAVYAGGQFAFIGGQRRERIARLAKTGTCAADPAWDFSPFNDVGILLGAFTTVHGVNSILPANGGVYVGGDFTNIAQVPRNGFALLASLRAPVITQDPNDPTRTFFAPAPLDRSLVSHLLIASVSGGTFFKPDLVTPVLPGEFITVEEGAQGLIFVPSQPGATSSVTAAESMGETTADAGSAMSRLSFQLGGAPAVLQLDQTSYTLREGDGPLVVTIQKTGSGAAGVDFSTQDGSAVAGPLPTGDYETAAGTLSFGEATLTQSFPITINNDTAFRGDRSFTISLSNPTGSAVLGARRSATVTIFDNDSIGSTDSRLTVVAPAALSPLRSTLTVILTGPATGQWRLVGESTWRGSGDTATGLATGNYQLEFKPVDGFDEPLAPPIAVTAPGTVTESFDYTARGPLPQSGALQVTLRPTGLATADDPADRGQWRREGEAVWHDSGETLTGLGGGLYRIEFKPVTGFSTPTERFVQIDGGPLVNITAAYQVTDPTQGLAPVPVAASDVTDTAPYVFNGQVLAGHGSATRFGSGFVVRDRVVLTAAHVVFDESTLTFTPELRWLAQKSAGDYEPAPISARGAYVFQGYAVQRALDDDTGISSLAAFERDAAALFFDRSAARGGSGGYLKSDDDPNEWLESSRDKMLVGYPLEQPDASTRGKLHATPVADLTFTRVQGHVFKTTGAYMYAGASGGPLYVRHENGSLYPAAIFIGGSGQTLVRAIDSDVVDLMNRADTSAAGGANSTSGGITLVAPGATNGDFDPAFVRCDLFPAAAVSAGAAWSINGGAFRPSGSRVLLPPGPFSISFKAVPGFAAPATQTINLQQSTARIIQATYGPPGQPPVIRGPLSRTIVRGTTVTFRIDATNSPSQFSATPLPAGLALNPVTGVISGSPAVSGQFTTALSAANANGRGDGSLNLRVLEPGRLSVGVNGAGTVSPPSLFGTSVVGQGSAVALTARAARGYVFGGWSGDIPGITPVNAFAMPKAANVVANFIPNPFLEFRGSYGGVLRAPSGEPLGVFTISLAGQGGFSLRLYIEGATHAVAGVLDLNGGSLRAEDPAFPYTLDLHIGLVDGTGDVTGKLMQNSSDVATLTGQRSGFDATSGPAPQRGRYTLTLPVSQNLSADPSPQGCGYGTVVVDARGTVRFTGQLGDATPATIASTLTRDGSWPLYLVLPGRTGYLAGPVAFKDLTGSDLAGTLHWQRTTATNGFDVELAAAGSKYNAPPVDYTAATLTLTSTALMPNPLAIALQIAPGTFAVTAPGGEGVSLSLNRATGLLSGRFTPTSGSPVVLRGALLQKSNGGAGLIQSGRAATGSLRLDGQ